MGQNLLQIVFIVMVSIRSALFLSLTKPWSFNSIRGNKKAGHFRMVFTCIQYSLISSSYHSVSEECSHEGARDSSVLLFETFKDAEKITSAESSKLKQTFGPYPSSLATRAFNAVQNIVQCLPEDSIWLNKNDTRKPYYGENFKFNINFGQKNLEELFGECDDETISKSTEDFLFNSFQQNLHINNIPPTSVPSKPVASSLNANATSLKVQYNFFDTTVTTKGANTFSSSWLYEQCREHLKQSPGTFNANDLASAVFEILNSNKTNDSIQNELFELMGFKAFDLIQKILENRELVIQVAKIPQENGFDSSKYQNIDPTRKPHKPVPGSQVTIQV